MNKFDRLCGLAIFFKMAETAYEIFEMSRQAYFEYFVLNSYFSSFILETEISATISAYWSKKPI